MIYGRSYSLSFTTQKDMLAHVSSFSRVEIFHSGNRLLGEHVLANMTIVVVVTSPPVTVV